MVYQFAAMKREVAKLNEVVRLAREREEVLTRERDEARKENEGLRIGTVYCADLRRRVSELEAKNGRLRAALVEHGVCPDPLF